MKIFFKPFFMISLVTLSCQLFAGLKPAPGEVIKNALFTLIAEAIAGNGNFQFKSELASAPSHLYYQMLKEANVVSFSDEMGIYCPRFKPLISERINRFNDRFSDAGDLQFDEGVKSQIIAVIDAYNKVTESKFARIQLPEFLRKESQQQAEVTDLSEFPQQSTPVKKPSQTINIDIHLPPSRMPWIVYVMPNATPGQIEQVLNPSAKLSSPQSYIKRRKIRLLDPLKRKFSHGSPPAYTEYSDKKPLI